MAEKPSEPSPELTEEQRQRVEANRLRALAKRKAFLSQQQQNPQNANPNPCWTLFKCRKLSDTSTPKDNSTEPGPRFRVRLEICSPDSFSVTPSPVQGFPYPGRAQCFRRLQDLLSNVMLTHYTQMAGGGEASVYKLGDYDAALKCLKNINHIEVEEIPWTTYNVLEKLSHSYATGKWIPCRPEHLPDDKVEELLQKLPKKLLNTLLPFQLDGVKFALQRGGRCLIADEMGLGKTLQAIAIASCFVDEGSILVVCPAILRYSWAEELEHWLSSYLPADMHLVFGYRNNPVHLTRSPKIVVISYHMLHRLRESILNLKWAVMIVDESHHIRCSKKKSEPREVRAVLDVASKTQRIILLSGTPSLSRPGLLGKNKFEFAKTYCSVKLVKDSQGNMFQDFSRGTRLEELNVLLRQTVMIRRLKEHLLVQLPPKRRQIIRLSLKKSDIISAKNAVVQGYPFAPNSTEEDETENDNVSDKSLDEVSSQVLGIAKVSGFLEWLSLHPIVTEADDSIDTEINFSSQKMIIFAHHHKVLDKVQEFLCEKGIGFVRIDGNTMEGDRQTAVKSFQSSKEVKIAMIGIQVGYAGLDLSVAHNVVFLELPKDPNSLLQAEDRAHRRGQTKAVNIYIFCAKDTSDESRWRRLNKSAQRVSTTINGKYDAVQEIKVDSVTYLGNSTVYQSVETNNAAVPSGECPINENVPHSEADDDTNVEGDEKFDVTPRFIWDELDELTQAQMSSQVNSLRFAVSQYTGRVHLCACDSGEDSTVRSLSVNFRMDEMTANLDERAIIFIKENPACQSAILSFINEWKNLKRMDQKKLFGKPLQLPLAIELLRFTESTNHDSKGLLKGGSRRRHTPLCEISYPLRSNALMKEVYLCNPRMKKEKKPILQFWTLMNEPLCKLCQNPCQGVNAKKPNDFLDLFCSLNCHEEYCSRTSGRFLREELFQIERGVCTNCQLDCHKLVQHLKPLTQENREKYIEKEAPQLTKHRKLMDKLVCEPTEGNAWHADHKIAVYKGGGECKVDNLRTLCVACHADVTATQAAERCIARKQLKKAMAGIRKNRKACGRAKPGDQGPSKVEQKTDDDELLIHVPGSVYSEPKEGDSKNEPSEKSSES